LQHWYKASIYKDVMATCGSGSGPNPSCYVSNNSPKPFAGRVTISAIDFASGLEKTLKAEPLSMATGVGVTHFFNLTDSVNGTTTILRAVITSSTPSPNFKGGVLDQSAAHATGTADQAQFISENFIPFAYPKDMKLPKANVQFTVADALSADGTVEVTVTSDKFALYVTLTTLAQGRFSDNAFVMLPGTKKLSFIPVLGFKLQELKSTLRVEHAATYM
jgi:hypothetical protein